FIYTPRRPPTSTLFPYTTLFRSNIRDIPSNLGEYFFAASASSGFQNFANNAPTFALQRFGNFGGRGGEELPLRQFSQFYFFEDDIRIAGSFTLNLGLRYENYGQPINRIAELNPNFGSQIQRDNKDFGPRVGFALGLGSRTVVRGGYGIYYNPTASSPISYTVTTLGCCKLPAA